MTLDFLTGQQGLIIGQRPDATQRLKQSNKVQGRMVRMEQFFPQGDLNRILPVTHPEGGMKKGKGNAVSRRTNDGIKVVTGSILKIHRTAIDSFNARFGSNGTVSEGVGQFGIQRDVGIHGTVGGSLQSQSSVRSLDDPQQQSMDPIANELRQWNPQGLPIKEIRGNPADEFGNEPVSLPHAQVGGLGDSTAFDGDITGGIAAANDQHALIGKGTIVFVGMRMKELTGKVARQRWHARIPVMSIGDHQVVKIVFFYL